MAFLAAVLRAGAFLAVSCGRGLLAAVLRAGAFLAVRFAAVLRAGAFRAGAFFTALLAAVFFAAFFAVVFLAAVFLAGAFRAEAFLAAAFFTAMDTPSLGVNADLNVEPVANRTPFDAGMRTAAPVRGFRPRRAARAVGVNVPNPTTVTFRPDRTSVTIVSNSCSTTSSTVRRVVGVESVTALTS